MSAAKKKASTLAPEPLQPTFAEVRLAAVRQRRADDDKIIRAALEAFEAWSRDRLNREARWLAEVAVKRELSPLTANMDPGSDRNFVAAFVQVAAAAMDLSATWEAQVLALPIAASLAAALRHERQLDQPDR